MPTSYTDQFFTIDPYNPPPAGTAVTFSLLTLTDQNDDLDFDANDNDSVDGQDILSSWPGDTVTIDIGGGVQITYVGITFYLADGRQVFTPNDGQVLQNGTLVSSTGVLTQGPLNVADLGPACFVEGTLILTQRGNRPIESLEKGDIILSKSGPVPLLYLAQATVDGRRDLAPIRFAPDSLQNRRELLVSPQHRMLLGGWRSQLYLGQDEVLVPAKHLVNGDTICRHPMAEVSYFHLLFENHEIVYGNGVPSESFDPFGDVAANDRQVMAELFELFPGGFVHHQTARTIVKRKEATLFRI